MEDQIIHISWAKIDFQCPYCEKQYEDTNDKYYKRLEQNNLGYTKTKCECGETFGIAIDITSQYVGFKLN